MNQLLKNLRERHEIQQKIDQKLRTAIINHLQSKRTGSAPYWPLHDTLREELQIPAELEAEFKVDFERVTQQMNADRICLKSWSELTGAYLAYPYVAGEQSRRNDARTVAAIHRLSMQVQYGDDVKL